MSQPMPYTPRETFYGVFVNSNGTHATGSEVDRWIAHKRLTDEQCAAEYWRLKADLCGFGVVTDSPVEIARKATTMHRFATTPHAFEVDDG